MRPYTRHIALADSATMTRRECLSCTVTGSFRREPMAKTKRVFELARELNVASKAILETCQAEGLELKNHMALVSIGLEATIRDWFSEHHTEGGGRAIKTAKPVDLTKVKKRIVIKNPTPVEPEKPNRAETPRRQIRVEERKPRWCSGSALVYKSKMPDDEYLARLCEVVRRLMILVKKINGIRGANVVFCQTPDAEVSWASFMMSIEDEDGFSVFIGALYVFLFDRTKGRREKSGEAKTLARLPRERLRDPIIDMIGTIRHKHKHLTDSPEWNHHTSAEAIYKTLIGKRHPSRRDDFRKMQFELLGGLENFLEDVLDCVDS